MVLPVKTILPEMMALPAETTAAPASRAAQPWFWQRTDILPCTSIASRDMLFVKVLQVSDAASFSLTTGTTTHADETKARNAETNIFWILISLNARGIVVSELHRMYLATP